MKTPTRKAVSILPLIRPTEEASLAFLQNAISLNNFSPIDLTQKFPRMISEGRTPLARDPVHRLDLNSLRKVVSESCSGDAVSVVSDRLSFLVFAADFLDWAELSSSTLTALVWFGLPNFVDDVAVQSRFVDFVSERVSSDPSFASVLPFLDLSGLSGLSLTQIRSLFKAIPLTPAPFGCHNVRTAIDSLAEFDDAQTSFKATQKTEWMRALNERAERMNADGNAAASPDLVGGAAAALLSGIEKPKAELRSDLAVIVKEAEEVREERCKSSAVVAALAVEPVRRSAVQSNGSSVDHVHSV
jgi:hypothetical protein